MKTQILIIHMLLEDIKQRDLDRWKKEYSHFSKNIRRIKSGKDLFKVFEGYKIWHAKFERWIYRSLLSTQQHKKRTWVGTSYGDELKSIAWDFVIQCQPVSMFFGRDLPTAPVHPTPTYKRYEDNWQLDYTKFEKIRNKNYSKFARLGKKTFDAVQKYWDAISGEGKHKVGDMLKHERVKIGPVTATVAYSEDDDKATKNIKQQIGYIKKGFAQLKSLGLDRVIRGMKIDIDMQQTGQGAGVGSLASAYYQPANDTIFLMFFTMPDTFVHEVAHRWWYQVLSKLQIDTWEKWIQDHSTCFEPFEIDLIVKAFKKVRGLNPEYSQRRDVWINISKELTGNVKLKYDLALKSGDGFRIVPIVTPKDSADKAMQDDDRLRTFIDTYGSRKRFTVEYITDYANTNPREAWAEVWRLYVEKKFKRIPPLTFDIFKRLIGAR